MEAIVHANHEDAQDVPQELRDQLLDPFIVAVTTALREWGGVEAVATESYQRAQPAPFGAFAATIDLTFPTKGGTLLLGFSRAFADALAGRVLADAVVDVDDNLVRDCLAELANVTAGQAKALLHGTPFRITFATPIIVAPTAQTDSQDCDWLVATIACDLGEFSLQVGVSRE